MSADGGLKIAGNLVFPLRFRKRWALYRRSTRLPA